MLSFQVSLERNLLTSALQCLLHLFTSSCLPSTSYCLLSPQPSFLDGLPLVLHHCLLKSLLCFPWHIWYHPESSPHRISSSSSSSLSSTVSYLLPNLLCYDFSGFIFNSFKSSGFSLPSGLSMCYSYV